MNPGSRTLTIGGVATMFLLVIGAGLWVLFVDDPPPIRVGVQEPAPAVLEPPDTPNRDLNRDPAPEFFSPEPPGRRATDMTPDEIEKRRGDPTRPAGAL